MDASSNGNNDDEPLFDRLPPELTEQIFGHLDLRERANARLVNQRWNDMAFNDVQLKLRINVSSDHWSNIPATTTADLVQRGSNRIIKPKIVVPGASLNEQIKQLPKALMDRVFEIELRLEARFVPPAGILNDIASSVIRPIKLHLDLTDAQPTPSMFSNSAKADASIAEEFPTLQLQSLSAIFEFPANGDYSAVNYFRMDKPSKDAQHIDLKLKRCGQSSSELPFVIERFPQLTSLEMEFGEIPTRHRNVEHLYREAPDWQKISQLTSLQKLTIQNNNHSTVLSAPELSKEFGLPELRTLRLHSVKLPPNNSFFQGTPNLKSLKYYMFEDLGTNKGYGRADIQAMTSAMQNGHLKQLTDVTIDLPVNNSAIDPSFEYRQLQLVCEAVSQNSNACPKFQRLAWADGAVLMRPNESDRPSLCKALMDLPAGILSQRPFTLEIPERGYADEIRNADECNELINALHAAAQQSGLKRLKLPKFRLTGAITETVICDLINATPPLSAIIDGNNVLRITWMHPTIEGYEQQIEMEVTTEEERVELQYF